MYIFLIVYIKVFVLKKVLWCHFWVNKKVFEHLLFSFLLTVRFEVELQGNTVILHLTSEETPTVSTADSTAAVPFHIPTSECTRLPMSLYPCQHLLFSIFFFFLITTNLVNIKWFLGVVKICISLMTNNFHICIMFSIAPPLVSTCSTA